MAVQMVPQHLARGLLAGVGGHTHGNTVRVIAGQLVGDLETGNGQQEHSQQHILHDFPETLASEYPRPSANADSHARLGRRFPCSDGNITPFGTG